MTRVMKLAQPGYDVKTAGDENLIYSSEWPLLPIYKSGAFTIPDASKNAIICEHNLGFYPMYWFFSHSTGIDYPPPTYDGVVTNSEQSEFFGQIGKGSIGIDKNKLTFNASTSFPPTGAFDIYYYIFAIDLEEQFTAPINKVGGPISGGDDRIFRIAKSGKDISSGKLDDYVIHSDCRSPLVHSVTSGRVQSVGGGQYGLSVQHNLGYNPMFFVYSKSNDKYSLLPTGTGGPTILTSNNQSVDFRGTASTWELSTVVLKDPFLIDYTREIKL